MFEDPLFLPVVLGVIVLGIFYLIVTGQDGTANDESSAEQGTRRWQVQCPKCQRWKKMQPIRREELLDEVEALKRSGLPGTEYRFLHEYKCKFCGPGSRWSLQAVRPENGRCQPHTPGKAGGNLRFFGAKWCG